MDKIKEFFLGNREMAKTEKLQTQLVLMARLLVGGYVVYLGKGLVDAVKTADTPAKQALFALVVTVFCVVGGILVYISIRDLAIGRYVGGKLDIGESEDEDSVVDVDKIDSTNEENK